MQSSWPPATLIHVLQELQFVTPDQLRQTLHTNHVSVRLGDLLVELGYLRTADLEAALEIQKGTQPKKKLGEILVEGHFIEARRLAEVLAFQLGFVYAEPNFAELDQDLLGQGSGNAYAEHLFIPTARQDSRSSWALLIPWIRARPRDCAGDFGKDLTVAIATKLAIQEALTVLTRGVNQPKATVVNDNTVVGLVNALFEAAAQEKASDIHIEPMKDRLRVRFRCDGMLVPHKEFRKELMAPITSRIKVLARADIAKNGAIKTDDAFCTKIPSGLTIDMRVSFMSRYTGKKPSCAC